MSLSLYSNSMVEGNAPGSAAAAAAAEAERVADVVLKERQRWAYAKMMAYANGGDDAALMPPPPPRAPRLLSPRTRVRLS